MAGKGQYRGARVEEKGRRKEIEEEGRRGGRERNILREEVEREISKGRVYTRRIELKVRGMEEK